MKLRIHRQSASQKILRLVSLPESLIDHPGVKQELCVLGAELKRLLNSVARVRKFAVTMETPGDHVIGVNVLTVIELAPRQRQSLCGFDVVIGVEISELSIVENLIECAQPPDILH